MTMVEMPSAGLPLRFWNWWTSELASLAAWRSDAVARRVSGVVVTIENASFSIIDERARGRRKAPIAGGAALDVIAAATRKGNPLPVLLRLPHKACFVRRVEVPEALRHEARRFLDLELERVTPFRLKDVYTAHIVDHGRSRRGLLSVQHLIVPREAIDKPRASIEAAGGSVAAVDVWSEDGSYPLPVNLIAGDGATASPPQYGPALRALLLAIAILAATAAYQAHMRHASALTTLIEATTDARTKAKAVQQMLDASDGALKDTRALEAFGAKRRSAVLVLEDLTRLLPDTVWLTDLRIEGTAIQITGEADAAAPLIALIEDSAHFSGAAFTTSVTRAPSSAKERFSLRARIGKGPAGVAEAAEQLP